MATMRYIVPATVLGLFLSGGWAKADVTTTFDSSVATWSSNSPPSDPTNGIYPIGGSGQPNGSFVVQDSTDGAEIGIRASLRNSVIVPTQTNDGNLATYYVPSGSVSGHPTWSLWNFDFDIDLRNTSGPQTISDYTATLTITNPNGDTETANLVTLGLVPTNSVLYQNSENPGFSFLSGVFPAFNPSAQGVYGFDLKLTPTLASGLTDTLEVKMDVSVAPEPSTIVAAGTGVVMALGGFWWNRRKTKTTA